KGIDSRILLRRVAALVAEAGYEVMNIDATVICEQPRVSPHVALMRTRIAEDLAIAEDLINLKGTTTEKMGFTGRGEGIAAMSVALIKPRGG
ncbi:MAG: 2-C-methyl-D-erythritol 2,4-cyclodiphosphate synthase, partial [Pseudomonadota bacterium]